ncbi:scavenger receptor cysteine-rich domain-containing protein DMBT1-like [Branchiostoma floridae x Branchiostoma belcheri]
MTVNFVFQMIHVQIQVNSSNADLQVFARTCVATPSDDPDDKTRNDVIVDGGAKLPTLQFYPSPSPDRGRFGFQAFVCTSGAPTVMYTVQALLCS